MYKLFAKFAPVPMLISPPDVLGPVPMYNIPPVCAAASSKAVEASVDST